MGLAFENGWYVLPSRGGPPVTNELVQSLLDEADFEDAGVSGRTIMEFAVGELTPRAVEFTASELVVTLRDGRTIATPLDWYPRLLRASAAERANYEIMPMGIHWPDIDEDLSIVGMLKGQRAK